MHSAAGLSVSSAGAGTWPRLWRGLASASNDDGVSLTQARLEQLLEFEITTMGFRESRPMTLERILNTTQDAGELAMILHEELPVRYAQRIKMLEALPGWEKTTSIAIVRGMYITSFKELRMADPRSPDFNERLRRIKKRHSHTNLLVGGFKAYVESDELREDEINEWLDRFFALRVSTNMLISHYLEIAEGGSKDEHEGRVNPYQSSINPSCHPYDIASHAAHVIGQLGEQWYGVAPEIRVTDVGAKPFPFVPRYLFYIMSELLKNSVRATVEHHCKGASTLIADGEILPPEEADHLEPVEVVVSSSDGVCCIRISDHGGGIPLDQLNHVWSYLYTTAQPLSFPRTRESVDAPTDLRMLDMGAFTSTHSLADGSEEQNILMRSPLAGLGCGLPLSRLYAHYLGGDIILHSLPRLGTDVFVYLNSLGNHSEELPYLRSPFSSKEQEPSAKRSHRLSL